LLTGCSLLPRFCRTAHWTSLRERLAYRRFLGRGPRLHDSRGKLPTYAAGVIASAAYQQDVAILGDNGDGHSQFLVLALVPTRLRWVACV
jgi:hypothetical protein